MAYDYLRNLIHDTQGRYILKLIKKHGLGIDRKEVEELSDIELADRKPQEGVNYYYYSPETTQANSRPFCIDMVSYAKVFSEDEINFLSYKLKYDVLKYRGGYNCKHSWIKFRGKLINTPKPTANQMRVLTAKGQPYK